MMDPPAYDEKYQAPPPSYQPPPPSYQPPPPSVPVVTPVYRVTTLLKNETIIIIICRSARALSLDLTP